MPVTNTDKTWKHYGRTDPYYGVLTRDEFKSDSLDDASKAEFFQSGVQYVEGLFAAIRESVSPSFQPARVLDFGCGVGRLALPFATLCESVVGVDVSAEMLAEAAVNARDQGLTNASFVESDDALSRVTGKFDLVHSFIVFQHIPPSRGELIVRRMIELLETDGVGALHFTYAPGSSTPTTRRLLTRAFERVPYLFGLRNIVKGRPFGEPLMQMNTYDVNRLLRILQEAGCHKVHLRFSEANHFRYPFYGVTLCFAKTSLDLSKHS